jgi:DNA polymerase III subunit epsilon
VAELDSMPWREATYAVVDLETTGLDPYTDEIISFAVVTVADGKVVLADLQYRLVRPIHMPGPETIRIHGLRESDLAAAPSLDVVANGLYRALSGRVAVAHVATVERGFLDQALSVRGLTPPAPFVDTAELAVELRRRRRQPIPRRLPIGLSDLARSLGLPVHRPHHADGDALTAAQVFLALATHLDRLEPQTVGSLRRLSCGGGGVRSIGPALRRLASRVIPS